MRYNTLLNTCILSGTLLASGTAFAVQNEAMQQADKPTTQKAHQLNESLKAKIEKALGKHEKNVTVLIKKRTVYLSGKLPSDTDYEQTVAWVEAIKDGHEVNVDELSVEKSDQPITDTYTTAKIKGQLIKTDLFDKDIPSWSVGVETKNGLVYLSGEVKSDADKAEILKVVKSVKGIKGINDQIKVKQQ